MKRKMYVDMEMASMDTSLSNVFPDPRVSRHNIISIVALDSFTLTYHVFVFRPDLRKDKYHEYRTLTDGKRYKIWIYKSGYENDILLWFAKLWKKHDYDLILGWNNKVFDMPYYFKRAEVMRILPKVGRLISHTGMIDTSWDRLKIPGSQIFDLMTAAKKQLGKYEDGSLNAVSKRILGVEKLGDTVAVVSQWMHDLDLLIDYNIRDVELTYLLDEAMPIYKFFEEQMDITGANIDETLTANYRVCQKYIMFEKDEHPFLDHFFCPTTEGDKIGFSGALNLTPQVGIHWWIAVHDLAMMYPNIMLACNMSPETIVKRENFTDEEWKKMDPVHVNGVYFRQDFVGFIPKLIMKQIALRKAIEDRIENFSVEYGAGFESTEIYKTYMTKRMNIKNLINSWYGVFGYEKFIMYNLDIAKSVTWLGVKQLEWSRDFVKREFNLDTKYGDSVRANTPVIIIDNAHLSIVEIQELEQIQSDSPVPLIIWTEKGWTEIKQIIKHRVKKEMFRVLTHTGFIEVTEDHSLLDSTGKEVSPKDISVGTELLHSFPTDEIGCVCFCDNDTTETIQAWCYGFFVADGSSGHYKYDTGDKYTWNISKGKEKIFPVLWKFSQSEKMRFKLIDVMESSQVWRIVPDNNGYRSVKLLVEKYSKCYTSKRLKQIPNYILSSCKHVKQAFFDGYYYGDGDKSSKSKRLDTNSFILAQGLYKILRDIGYNISFNTRLDKPNIIRLNVSTSKPRKNPFKIKKLESLGICDEIVYDLETENHHFAAGVGQLIVHNTDSIFVTTPNKIADLKLLDKLVLELDTLDEMLKNKAVDEDMMDLLRERKIEIQKIMDEQLKLVADYHSSIGDAITASYDEFSAKYNIKKHTFSMKFEKMYRRIFFSLKKSSGKTAPTAAKKRYAGHIIYKDGKFVDKTDVSGFQTRRSDTAKITAQCQNELFRILTRSPDPVNDARNHLRDYYLKVMVGDLHPNIVGIPNGFGMKLRSYKKKSRTYHWYAAQWSNQYLGTNYDKGSKPKYIPLKYVPPPYNVTPFHLKNKDKWVAFSDDFPLKREFRDVINWPMVAKKTIIDATENIAMSIGIRMESVTTGLRKLSMEEAF